MRTLPVMILVLGLTGCDFEDFADSQRSTEDFRESHKLKAGGRVELENYNGSVEITGWDRDEVDIAGTKYAPTKERLAEIKIQVTAGPDGVRVRTERPSERGNWGAKYVIHVPRRCELARVVSTNGHIRVTDVEGPVRLRTSNGAIGSSNVKGPVEAQTTNGGVEIRDVTGDVTARTSNGKVTAEGIRGSLDATTTNGPVRAHVLENSGTRDVRVGTSNGSVDLRLDAPLRNGVRVNTTNGGITLRLPAGTNARLDASTSNATVASEFEVKASGGPLSKKHLEGTIGSGGPRIEATTTQGSIKLIKL